MTIKDKLGLTTGKVEFVPKGWGYEKILCNGELYCGKLLHFVAGRRCSAHYHLDKTETFYLHRGRMEVYYFDDLEAIQRLIASGQQLKAGENVRWFSSVYDMMEKVILYQGMTFEVPVRRVHQMIALEDCELFEFSTQDDPEDSYRIIKGD